MRAKCIAARVRELHAEVYNLEEKANATALEVEEVADAATRYTGIKIEVWTLGGSVIHASLTVDRLRDATNIVRAFAKRFGKPEKSTDRPRTSWKWVHNNVLVNLTVALTNNVCKRVQVGTKTVTIEQPIYEIQCPPEEVDIDTDTDDDDEPQELPF